jgi:hypothetical protein
MKNFLIFALCLSNAVLLGCATNNQPPANGNVVTVNTAAKPNSKTEMPKTEKADKDFVPSESGTEKAKPEVGKANVQGVVLYNEKPVEGVEVKLCEKFNNFIGGCNGETFKTKTDANGEYLFANVTPRIYEGLLVKVFDTKNYIFATQGFGISSAKYKIEADETFFAPETNLFKDDLKLQNPKKSAKVDAKSLDIKWDAYPDAAYYKLSLSPKEYDADSSVSEDRVEATNYKVEKNLKSGEYTLRLSAFNANDVKLSDVDDVKFTVTGGDEAANVNAQ